MGPKQKQINLVPTQYLDDIASRFLLDAQAHVISDPISLCFLTEIAHWFYLDEYVSEDKSLCKVKMDQFAKELFRHVDLKDPHGRSMEEMLQGFREFKHAVPTYGGLMMDQSMTYVLLVQGFYHNESWGFPKGKINIEEAEHDCAIREVLEETGYDMTSLLDSEQYLETSMGEQKSRLYLIRGVPMDTAFVPQTRGEIKETKWFPISQIPSNKNERCKMNSSKSFYMAHPFIKPLREWIGKELRKDVQAEAKLNNHRKYLPTRPAEDSHQKFTFKSKVPTRQEMPGANDFMSFQAPSWKHFQLDTANIFAELEAKWKAAS